MSKSKPVPFPIVGIGASAGGLEALQSLVSAIPCDSGLAYVIVQHLSPDHPSIMNQLLEPSAQIPVHVIENGQPIRPNVVYVTPAGPAVTIVRGCLYLHEREETHGVRTPIDRFFISLADAIGSDAFCIVLSGTGSDGTGGVRAIKSSGGIAFVQGSESARFPGMPESAAATGLVDFVLRPSEMPARLIDIVQHRKELFSNQNEGAVSTEIMSRLSEILEIIGAGSGHDFTSYKSGTLLRRIERRMTLLRLSSVQGLLDLLRDDKTEQERLLQDFLIGVTQFFRDPEVFTNLRREVILPLLERDQPRFRIWVPGCSTGEEAVSIVMLMADAMAQRNDTRPFQVFGTDIDATALLRARSGRYSESSIAQIPLELRNRYLQLVEGSYQMVPELREQCIFAPHNLVRDPPFSKLDLVSCRNLLIYLSAEMQDEILPRMHYALNPGGFLLLGPSESVSRQEQFFHTVDRESRLFKRNDAQRPGYSALSMQGKLRKLSDQLPTAYSPAPVPAHYLESTFESQVTRQFLRESAAPFAVINARDEVVYLSERMGAFVQPSTGVLSTSLDQFLAQPLRLPVRNAIEVVRESTEPFMEFGILVPGSENNQLSVIDLDVRPLSAADDHVMVTLQPVRTENFAQVKSSAQDRSTADLERVEHELVLTRQQLSRTRSSFENSEQELRSSNEELLSMNEELQSSNEELETSREELQSINEELETVNAELAQNNRKLNESNSDLRNLFESTDVATLFLDQSLCVRRFTPAMRKLLGVQDRDRGRPIQDLAWRVKYEQLEEDAKLVAETLQPISRELSIEPTDETWSMRIRAYRRIDDRIDGCVITFFDVTARKRNERQLAEYATLLQQQYAELEALYSQAPIGLCLIDRDMRWVRANKELAAMNGFSVEEHIGTSISSLLPDLAPELEPLLRGVLDSGEPALGREVRGTTPAEPGQLRAWIIDYYPVSNDDEVIAIGACIREVTAEKKMQRQIDSGVTALRSSEEKLQRMFDQSPAYIGMFEGPEHRFVYANPVLQQAIGKTDLIGQCAVDVFDTNNYAGVVQRLDQSYATKSAVNSPEIIFKVGNEGITGRHVVLWLNEVLQPWGEIATQLNGVLMFAYDISEQVRSRQQVVEAQAALAQSEAFLSASLRAGRIGAFEFSADTGHVEWDSTMRRIWGFQADEQLTLEKVVSSIHPDDLNRVRAELQRLVTAEDETRTDMEYRVVNGDTKQLTWVHTSGDLLRKLDGTRRVIGTTHDVTEQRLASQRQELLLHELQHRVKNSMAITLAIVQLSASKAQDLEAFASMLSDRLQAIARTHDLLTANEWYGGSLLAVVSAELEPYNSESQPVWQFTGEDVYLPAKQLLALTLAFHELATNAVRHGALSVSGGRVDVKTINKDGQLTIIWNEIGGPRVTPPKNFDTGFGSFLLNEVLSAEVTGTVELDYEPNGVVCRIVFSLNTN